MIWRLFISLSLLGCSGEKDAPASSPTTVKSPESKKWALYCTHYGVKYDTLPNGNVQVSFGGALDQLERSLSYITSLEPFHIPDDQQAKDLLAVLDNYDRVTKASFGMEEHIGHQVLLTNGERTFSLLDSFRFLTHNDSVRWYKESPVSRIESIIGKSLFCQPEYLENK